MNFDNSAPIEKPGSFDITSMLKWYFPKSLYILVRAPLFLLFLAWFIYAGVPNLLCLSHVSIPGLTVGCDSLPDPMFATWLQLLPGTLLGIHGFLQAAPLIMTYVIWSRSFPFFLKSLATVGGFVVWLITELIMESILSAVFGR